MIFRKSPFTPLDGPKTVKSLTKKCELSIKGQFSECLRVRKLKYGINDVYVTI